MSKDLTQYQDMTAGIAIPVSSKTASPVKKTMTSPLSPVSELVRNSQGFINPETTSSEPYTDFQAAQKQTPHPAIQFNLMETPDTVSDREYTTLETFTANTPEKKEDTTLNNTLTPAMIEQTIETATPATNTNANMSIPAQPSLNACDATVEAKTDSLNENVQTLIRLVRDLPEGVTKQTGAKIIRTTMEAVGISIDDVLGDAQNAQSDMLDAVRANIKKIEEYQQVINRLKADIKHYEGQANELSEVIDLFILSHSAQRAAIMD